MDTKTYRVTDPDTQFVCGRRVVEGRIALTEDQARYDLQGGVIVEDDAPKPSKPAKSQAEG